ncbi:MAG: DM13 domain-containing protein [Paracoccaceae bacterium]
MKRFLAIALPSFALGAGFGAAFWYLASPLWIDRVVDETLTVAGEGSVLARGTFSDADAAHKGSGTVAVVKRPDGMIEIQLTDFRVTNGPDLEVWLSAHPDPKSSSDVTGADWVSLGLLKGNVGNQSYVVPPSADIARFRSVAIWCEQFGVLFSPAPLSQ